MSCEDLFLEKLRQQGFRLTPQREIVLKVMHQMENLATVEEIYQKVREQSAAIDISTVYRTLELLQEFHMVSVVEAGDGQRRYELTGIHGAHVHLVCQSCKRIIPVDVDEFDELIAHLRDAHGFHLDAQNLSLSGLCAACHAGEQESSAPSAVHLTHPE